MRWHPKKIVDLATEKHSVMTQKLFTLIISLFATIGIAGAQDTIMLMRGKRIVVSSSKIEVTAKGDTVVSYQLPNGKQKSKRADKVFSVSQGGREHILYVSDTAAGDLTVDQMRRFLQGKADYSGGFSWGFFAGGVAATAVGAAIPSACLIRKRITGQKFISSTTMEDLTFTPLLIILHAVH